ncbi:MAG: hypothetical protein PHX51_08320 [Clostridia bacterium]|nr:hypothetical protein [Clostridia bacterium]
MPKTDKVKLLEKEITKTKFVTENFVVDSIAKHVDNAGQEYTTFRAKAQQIDIKNGNKRIYTKEGMDEAGEIVMKQIEKKAIYCLVDHPDMLERTKIKNAGAYVTKYEVIGQDVFIEGKFIQNDTYIKYLKPLIDSGAQVGLSVRGYTVNDGNPSWDNEKDAWIYGKGYRIDGWDFVLYPAVEEAGIVSLEELDVTNKQSKDNKEEKVMDFKTYSELRANFPHLFVDEDNTKRNLETAIATEKKALIDAKGEFAKTLDEKVKENQKALDEKVKENQKALDEKNKEIETLNSKLKTTEASLDAVKTEMDNIKFQSELSKIVADCKYKEYISVPSHIKTVADAKAYLDSEVTRLDTFLAKFKPGTAAEKIVDGKPVTPAEKPEDAGRTPVLDEQDMWLALGRENGTSVPKTTAPVVK